METPGEQESIIKRARGRPRKEVPEIKEPKKRGRPRLPTPPSVNEIREKMKPGPKTNVCEDENYFNNYYHNHYKGLFTTCPLCHDPHVA